MSRKQEKFNYKQYQNQQKNAYGTMQYKDTTDKKIRHMMFGFVLILVLGTWAFVSYNAKENHLTNTQQIQTWYETYVNKGQKEFDPEAVGKLGTGGNDRK